MDVARRTQITPRRVRRWLAVLAPRKARPRQSDAGVALPSGRDSDVSTAAAYGHTYAGQRKVDMDAGSNFTRR